MTFHPPEITEDKGLYPKYVVFRHPRQEAEFFLAQYKAPGATSLRHLEEVEDFCFVLKPLKDRHARLALAVYAESVRKDKPRLAAEIKEWLDDFQGS